MTNFDPAKHPTGRDGRFVNRTAGTADLTLPAPGTEEVPLVPPSGCGICGEEARSHGMRLGGGHLENMHYVEPTREQRKERIIASVDRRRAIREGLGSDGPEPVAEEDLVHPSGCSICGGTRGYHGITSKGGQGFHSYQEPGPDLRKERIKAIVAARRAATAEGRTGIAYSLPLW